MDPFDPVVLDPSTVALIIAGVGLSVLCGGGAVLLALALYLGVALLRRDGETVTVQRAVRKGAETLMFIRKEGVLTPVRPGDPEAEDAE